MPKKQATIDDVLNVLNDFQGLVAERFDEVDRRFDRVEVRLDEHDRKFDQINRRFDQTDRKIDQIYGTLDAHMKRIEEILQENAMRDRQQERMERWIFQLADKLGVKLNYD